MSKSHDKKQERINSKDVALKRLSINKEQIKTIAEGMETITNTESNIIFSKFEYRYLRMLSILQNHKIVILSKHLSI